MEVLIPKNYWAFHFFQDIPNLLILVLDFLQVDYYQDNNKNITESLDTSLEEMDELTF